MNARAILSALSAPFPADAISWRVGSTSKDKSKGMALAYIDSRDVQDRLDAVVGPENWRDEYQEIAGFVVCKLWIRIDGEWIWKCDGAGKTDVEAEKGMLSDSFKRAAVKWGIGRYLYSLDSPWVAINEFRQIEKGEYGKLRQLLTRNAAGPAPVDSIPHEQPKQEPPRQERATPPPTVKPSISQRASAAIRDPKALALERRARMTDAESGVAFDALTLALDACQSPEHLHEWATKNKGVLEMLADQHAAELRKAYRAMAASFKRQAA